MRKSKVIIMAGVTFCILLGCIFVAVNRKMSEEQEQRDEVQTIAMILESASQVRKQVQESENMEMESEASISDDTEEPEYTLAEMIANPLLRAYPWDECEREKPYVSYAEAEGKNPREYEKQPKPYLDDAEEIRAWGEDILYELVLHPEKVEDYGAVLTKSSIEAWNMFPWVYANPGEYYYHKHTDFSEEPQQGYYLGQSYFSIPPKYWYDSEKYDSLDHTFAEGVTQELLDYINIYPRKWYDNKIVIIWECEQKSGLIQVEKMDYLENDGLHISDTELE